MNEHKINLLIVDDEEQFLHSLGRSLEMRGFHVITVNRGEQALEQARRQPIDIALVDLKMPGLDGHETLAALKMQHPWMEVVILTGHGTIDSAVECTRSGAFSFLQKPCEMDRLMTALVEAYKQRVMNKKQIEEKKMASLMRATMNLSPREILDRLKEIDRTACSAQA